MSNYEAWKMTFQSSEQAARAAFNQLQQSASPVTEQAARAEFRQWLNENQGEFQNLGDTMAGLMERAAVAVATQFQEPRAQQGGAEPVAGECPECGSDDVAWNCLLAPSNGAPEDGR